jgi:hypothetical protein
VFLRNDVYVGVTGWESFEPWLTRLEEMSSAEIASCAENIPPEWYEHDDDGLNMLVQELDKRRKRVRRLIDEFRKSSRLPFPNWREESEKRPAPTVPATWADAVPDKEPGRWN